MDRRPRNFASIEAGRGIAALLVVTFHATAIFALPEYWNMHIFGGLFSFGYAGVEFFFVLSGFIIAHVHGRDIGHPERCREYVRRRLVRVYPTYWVVLAGLMVVTLLPLGLGVKVTDPAIYIRAILLIGPNSEPQWVATAWTLFHELVFYAVFALAILSRRLGLAAALLWLVAIAAGAAGFTGLPAYVMSPINLLFGLGMIAGRLAYPRYTRWPWLWVAVGTIGYLAIGLDSVFRAQDSTIIRNLLFGFASAVGMTGIVAVERLRPLAVPALMLELGAASYSIYLTHFPLLSILAKAVNIGNIRHLVPPELMFVILFVVAVAGGLVFHRLVEQPLRRAVDRWSRQKWPAPAAV